MEYVVKDGQAIIYAFVIMPNHIHAVWHVTDKKLRKDFQRDFLKQISKRILDTLKSENNPILAKLMVDAKDRKYQIWERNSMSTNLYSEHFFHQKMDYLHKNPVSGKWNLCKVSEDYEFSSASYYDTGASKFGFLTDYRD